MKNLIDIKDLSVDEIEELIKVAKDIMQNFYISISEFLSMANLSSNFENKLFEHGKAIIKNNAILTGIKYFVH